jgi:gluconokinase
MIIILMGVSGSGKTTIGLLLSNVLGWEFIDADDLHPEANIEKMTRGIALTDADRDPWLEKLGEIIKDRLGKGQSTILACSALTRSYRSRLKGDHEEVQFVHLSGDFDLIRCRMGDRNAHFMRDDLLLSQFETLEKPQGILEIDISQEPEMIVVKILHEFGLEQDRVQDGS